MATKPTKAATPKEPVAGAAGASPADYTDLWSKRPFPENPSLDSYDPRLHKFRTCSPALNIAGVGGLNFSTLVELWGPPKCHAEGEIVLGADGSKILVQDLKIGDKLMGIDGSPRTVLDHYKEKTKTTYIVKYFNGATSIVSGEHLLPVYLVDPNSTSEPDSTYISPDLTGFKAQPVKDLYDIDAGSCLMYVAQFGVQTMSGKEVALPESFGTLLKNYTERGSADLSVATLFKSGVPEEFVKSSFLSRVKFLQGFLGKEGNTARFVNYEVGNDILFIINSLGLGRYIDFTYTAHTFSLSGVEVLRNVLKAIYDSSDTWYAKCSMMRVTDINKIDNTHDVNFYGFKVDGNSHYLDANFVMHHNSGKSTLAYQSVGDCFLNDYGNNAMVLILDSENSADTVRLQHIFGIRIGNHKYVKNGDPRVFIEPAFTLEQGVEHIMRYARIATEQGKFLAVIWDSITTSKPKREYEYINGVLDKPVDAKNEVEDTRKEAFGTNMSLNQLRPQIIKWGLNQIMSAIYMKPVIVFLINQATTKLTMHGASESSGGGYGFKHNIHYSIKAKFIKKIGENPIYHTGTLTSLSVEKSKVMPSLTDILTTIRDDEGGRLQPNSELFHIAKEMKWLVEKNGGWYQLKEEIQDAAHLDLKTFYQLKDITDNKCPVFVTAIAKALEKDLRNRFKLVDINYQERDNAISQL